MAKTYEENLVHYGTAPRATAGKITNKHFETMWAGKLRGKFVSMPGQFKFLIKEDAIDLAKRYRQSCFDEAKSKGLF